MQSVSDDDVWKKLVEKPHFELAAKGVSRLGRCYIFWQGVPGLWASNWESTATDGWSLDRWHQKTIGACRTKRPSSGKTVYWHEQSKIRRCTSLKNTECQQGDLLFGHLWNAQLITTRRKFAMVACGIWKKCCRRLWSLLIHRMQGYSNTGSRCESIPALSPATDTCHRQTDRQTDSEHAGYSNTGSSQVKSPLIKTSDNCTSFTNTMNENKKALLSQRWPRDAPYI